MNKQKEYLVAETNLANFGTDLEKKIKEASAQGEKAWEGAGTKEGLQIWRIEQFKVKKSKDRPGKFYENDSYIVLNTYKKGNSFKYDIHFWLGKTTTQDEAGTAAYKTVELDNYLKGKPAQHREVADHESSLFLSYFDKYGGITIMEGGAESGFNRVKPKEYRTRLLWIKGKKHVRIKEVPLSCSSLNKGDIFILDCGLTLYQWNGPKSSIKEKARAAQIVRVLDSSRSGRPKIIVMEHGQEEEEFWKILGGKGRIKEPSEAPSDEEWEKKSDVKLFKLSDGSGELKFTLMAEGKAISPKLLDPNAVFVLDVGPELFVWIGKSASVGERKFAMSYAQDYLKKNKRPAYLPITLIYQGHENEIIKKLIKYKK